MNQLHVCPSPVSTIDSICGMVSYILFSIFFFFTINFYPFLHIFDPHCPVQVNGGKFSSSKLKSTLNFSLESILYSIFWPIFFFFSHQMSAKPGSDLEPCRMTKRAVALHLPMMGVRYIRLR